MELTVSRVARPLVLTVAILLCASVRARAQSINAALDLLLPIGARATALGTAVVAEAGSDAIWWNPAGLARLTKPVFALDHFATFQIESGDAVSLVLPAGPVGVFAIGARLFNFGTTTTTGTNNEELGSSSLRSIAVGGSFAASFGERFSAGLSFRLYQLSAPCSGICDNVVSGDFSTGVVDAGVQYRPSAASPFEFGAVLSNMGPNLQVHDQLQADELPARLHVGMSYRPTSPGWDPAIRVRTNVEFVSTPALSTREVHVGGELGYVSEQATVSLRGGYIYQESSGPESSVGPSIGFGLTSGRVRLDFAQVFDTFSTGLGKTPRFVSIRVGL